jgi:hypothetical protein
MDRHQGEEDEERKRQRLEATKTRAARMRDNDPSESEEDEPRPPSKKRKKRTTSTKESEEEEVITLEGKPSALRKFLKGSTRSKSKYVTSYPDTGADYYAEKRVRSKADAPVTRDERVGTPDPAWSTVGELPEEDNTSTSFHPRGLYFFLQRGVWRRSRLFSTVNGPLHRNLPRPGISPRETRHGN